MVAVTRGLGERAALSGLNFASTHFMESAPITRRLPFIHVADVVLIAAAPVLLGLTAQLDDGVDRLGLWTNALAVLLVVYLVRLRLLFGPRTVISSPLAFATVLALLLPFILAYVNLLRPPFGLPIHHWLGDPIWLYFVPVTSFVLFDQHAASPSRIWTLLRFALELAICFPIWTYLWVVIQFVVTDEILGLFSR